MGRWVRMGKYSVAPGPVYWEKLILLLSFWHRRSFLPTFYAFSERPFRHYLLCHFFSGVDFFVFAAFFGLRNGFLLLQRLSSGLCSFFFAVFGALKPY